MATGCSKTEAGQREIRERSANLAGPARMLLVLADGVRTRGQLLQMVQSATPADLQGLFDAGLIAQAEPQAPSRGTARDAGASGAAVPEQPEPAAQTGLGYQELYDSLNALAKEQLGLLKGFRYALEIEKAEGLSGLRDVAHRFADDVQRSRGDTAAQMVRRALALPR